MGATEFSILIALTVAMAAWALGQLLMGGGSKDKRDLQRRLQADSIGVPATDESGRSILVQREPPLPGALGQFAFFRKLNARLVQAYPEARLTRFLCLCSVFAAIGFLILMSVMDSAGAGLIGAAGMAYLPLMFVNGRRARRQRAIAQQLPEALDFLARVLRAGHSLSTGLQMMGDELNEPLAGEFRRAYSQHSLGQALEDSLREMSTRIESTDFAFFVTAVLIQRQTGGDLSEVLSNISDMVRQRIRLAQHVKAITAEGRMTSYVLTAFPVVLFVITYTMNPEYAGLLVRTDTGRMLLGAAAALVFFGLMVIRRIVTVRI